jgi:hypothetical protein
MKQEKEDETAAGRLLGSEIGTARSLRNRNDQDTHTNKDKH